MNTAELMPIEDEFKPFRFYFVLRILYASLRRDILMINLFGPALYFSEWQSLNIIKMNFNFNFFKQVQNFPI